MRMRTLVLMRHAKSAYPAGVDDHDRPLADRGEREAALAGDWLRENVPPIDAVLCSSALRTRQTLVFRTGAEAPTSFLDRLYGASPGDVIDEINKVPTTSPPCWWWATSRRRVTWRWGLPGRAATAARPSRSR